MTSSMECLRCHATKEGTIDEILAWNKAHDAECLVELQLRTKMRGHLHEALEDGTVDALVTNEHVETLVLELTAALRKRGLVIVEQPD